jgi:uncharacterized membrane protein
MAKSPPARSALRLPYPLRVMRARPRLILSFMLGLAVLILLPSTLRLATRLVLGWDVAVILYLALIYTLMTRSRSGHIRDHAAREDEGRLGILVLTVAAALASLGAILSELGTSGGSARTPTQLALGLATIVLSWTFIHTLFAVHYAHEYYGAGGKKACLNFPGDGDPDYLDFVYFSFVIGMTCQVSDVAVASKPTRRVVNGHGIVSFFFNTALLALTVNIAANAI